MVIELDEDDLAKLDAEITNWQIHNSFTTTATGFQQPNNNFHFENKQRLQTQQIIESPQTQSSSFRRIVAFTPQNQQRIEHNQFSDQDSFSNQQKLLHEPSSNDTNAASPVQTEHSSTSNNNNNNNQRTRAHIQDDPLHLYSEQNQLPAYDHNDNEALEWNHQLELEQMAALAAELSASCDNNLDEYDCVGGEQESFIDGESFPVVPPPDPIVLVPTSQPEPLVSTSSLMQHNTNSISPALTTLSPLNDNNQEYQSENEGETEGKLSILIQEIERLKAEKHQMQQQFQLEREKLKQYFARSDHTSTIAAIKSALEKETEYDLLQLKKDILQQKEQQLQAIREEMRAERDLIEHQMQDQIDLKNREWSAERETMGEEIQQLKRENSSLRENIEQQQEKITHNMVVTKSSQIQTDPEKVDSVSDCPSVQIRKLRSLNAHLQERETECLLQIGRQETLITEKTEEIFELKSELADSKLKCEKLQMEYARLKKQHSRSIPDPLNILSRSISDVKENQNNTSPQKEAEIEERYAKAYESAVKHLKESYSVLTSKLKMKTEQAHQDAVARVRKELEKILEDKESVIAREKAQVAALSKQVEWLESELETQRETLQQTMNSMKMQYLTTLKQMREDVAKSKARSIERIKEAWKKKKQELDSAWQAKLDAANSGNPKTRIVRTVNS